MRHDPASGAIVIMLRSLKMHGMAQAVTDLIEQGAPAFEAAVPVLTQLLKAEMAEREVRSIAYHMKAARFPAYKDLAGFDFSAQPSIDRGQVRDLAEAGDDPDRRQAAWDRLCNTNRLAFVRRWWGHPDFDLGVVMAWGYRDFARDPLLAPYCTPRRDRAFFRRFRYQLCLTGYDHGSNFIGAIDGQSVLLAEQDGWEVFYSGRFQPWKHFIPLARHGTDIAEKLAWARENPGECKAMAAAARTEAALLRRPATRRAIMARILDGLAEAG